MAIFPYFESLNCFWLGTHLNAFVFLSQRHSLNHLI